MSGVRYDLGILGGGQLARMTVMAAQRMGLNCVCLDEDTDSPAGQVAPVVQGGFGDIDQMAEIFRVSRRVTLENEFVPAQNVLEALRVAGVGEGSVLPGAGCLGVVQDKLTQRLALRQHGVPSPVAVPAGEAASLGTPVVLKARFGGYDGKGTRYARSLEELDRHLSEIDVASWLAEEFVDFRRELAVMVCRSEVSTVCFPTMETVQVNHVCDTVFPAGTDASEVSIAAVEAVGGYGLFGVELFETTGGEVLVNEIAPRPHNTGHYTLDWGGISQFEAVVRLVLGIPVPTPTGMPSAMANLLGQSGCGDHRSAVSKALAAVPGGHFHWYGKREAREGRKMGHVNAVGPDARETVTQARRAFYEAWASESPGQT